MTTPKTYGKYQIRHLIGKGSMGVVYEAFDPVIQRRVAVKVIRQDDFGATQGADLIARLKREAQAAGRLSHPGIVSIYDFGEDTTPDAGSVAYIAMELIEGRELKAMLDAGQRCTPQQAVHIVSAVLAALQHAHERGVTHRDIKPANVMLLAEGGVKLADFGVARIEASELTQAGTIIGTPMYMSPEQILGLPVDGRSDLFSCGVLLYELLTATKPFTGSVATVIRQVLEVDPPPPSRADSTLGPRWDALVHRALAKKPEQRFASAREMAAALQEVSLVPDDADATVAVTIRPPLAAAPPPAAAAAAGAHRSRRVVGGVIAAALVAGGAAYLAWPPGVPSAVRQLAAASAPVPAAAAASLPEPHAAPSPATATATAAASPPASAVVVVAVTAAQPSLTPPKAPSLPVAAAPASAVPVPAAASHAQPKPARPVAVEPARTEAKAPPDPVAADWAARLDPSRLEATPPATLAAALRRVLDPFDAGDAGKLIEFEALLIRQPSPFAYVLGVSRGRLVHAWAEGADAAAAAASARRRCAERHAAVCQSVLIDGALRRKAFNEVVRGLGAQPARAVRVAWMQLVSEAMADIRRDEVARQKIDPPRAAQTERATPAPLAPAPPAAPTVPAAQAEWSKSRARLRDSGAHELGAALAILLGAGAASERQELERFQTQVKRLRWKSALAMGESPNGYLAWHYVQGESRAEWAEERALALCSPRARGGCVVVSVNGDCRPAAMNNLAARLGARSQTSVREAFVKSIPGQFP